MTAGADERDDVPLTGDASARPDVSADAETLPEIEAPVAVDDAADPDAPDDTDAAGHAEDAAASSAPVSAEPASSAPQRPRRDFRALGWMIAAIVLALAVIALIANSLNYRGLVRDWRDYAAEMDAANHVLGEQVALERKTVQEKTQEIELLSQQLSTAQQRITELADLTAQAGDNVQYFAQEINRLNEVLEASTAVSAALNRCVDGHQELLTYVKNASNYDPQEVAEFEESLATLCERAESAHTDLQKVLKP